jgi:hypothetical protein
MRVSYLAVASLAVGCAGSPTPEPAAPVAETVTTESAPTLVKSADSEQVDRVGTSDGALAPDGVKDIGLTLTVDGPVEAIFVVAVDASGAPSGVFQADTLVGNSESPRELGAKPGAGTSGLGVFDADKLLNSNDGSLTPLAAGAHRLTLYLSPPPSLAAGKQLRVYVQRPDKSLVTGPALAL